MRATQLNRLEIEMIRRAVLGVAAVTLAAGFASASSGKSGGDDPDKVVCKTEKNTETRLGRTRACRTNAEWTALRRQSRRNVDRTQDSRPDSRSN